MAVPIGGQVHGRLQVSKHSTMQARSGSLDAPLLQWQWLMSRRFEMETPPGPSFPYSFNHDADDTSC
jgi:hypothetical protein